MIYVTSLTMTVVGLVLVIVMITMALYDFVLVEFFGKQSTISQFLIGTAFAAPMISCGFGWVGGHLFSYMWPMQMPSVEYSAWRATVWTEVFYGALLYAGVRELGVRLWQRIFK